MRHKGNTEATTDRLIAYLEGEVTPSEASKLEAELRESPMTKRRLASLRKIRDAISESLPEHRDLDLVPQLRQALARPAPLARPTGAVAWRTSQWAAAAAGGILLIGISWMYRSPRQDVAHRGASQNKTPSASFDEFRAKSGNSGVAAPSQWAGVRIFRVTPTGKPERLAGTLSTVDGLLFSYTNLGKNPFDYLAIFAVDTHKNVHWFYPAYEQTGTNPTSIGIKRDVADVPLTDLIRQDWAPGPIAIHALFSSRPLHVLELEALIEQAGDVAAMREPLSLSGTLDQVTTPELVQ